MDTETLRLFVAVARRGSFAAVARAAASDPSAVSRTIAVLEDELGVRLLQRSTRRMALTEAGARYLARVAPLLDELDHAREDAAATGAAIAGTVRVTTSVTYGHVRFVPLLPALHAAFPRLTLDLVISDARLDLVAEGIDLAIRLGPATHGELIGVKLSDTRYQVCASPAWIAGHGRPAEPAALRGVDCVLFHLGDFRSRWQFRDAAGAKTDVPVGGRMVLSSLLAVRACTVAGMGPALLPNWLAEEALAEGALVDLFPAHGVTATDFATAAWLLYPSRAYLPGKVRAVIDFLRPRLR
jgi:DNA-binding transcriptional LysR family regulator